MRPVWAEIDLTAIEHNCNLIKKLLEPTTELMAIIKADAYGHGAIPVAKSALSSGATWLGVSSLEEALEIRYGGIEAPVLILGYTSPEDALTTVAHKITQTVFSPEQGLVLNEAAKKLNSKAQIHVKIDTGMSRLGFAPVKASLKTIKELSQLSYLVVQGIYTHLADAGNSDKTTALRQLQLFQEFIQGLEAEGIIIPVKHTANSAAILNLPESRLDLVRAGIIVYGLYPYREEVEKRVDFRPALSLKTKIVHLKEVGPGTAISYGGTYVVNRPSVIATLPLGYADGINRLLSNQGEALIRGKRAKIAGKVCMDQLMVDVTEIEAVAVGDEAVLIGKQGKEEITSDEIARRLNTINYEVVCSISSRVARRHLP
ncbi:MAG: alanine racemase [Bacillota bacterium]